MAELNVDYSGYVFANNSPILYSDPLGLDTLRRNADGTLPTTRIDGSKLQDVDVILGENGQIANYYNGESWQAPKELKEVTVSFVKKPKEKKEASSTSSNNKTTQQPSPNLNSTRGQREAEVALGYPGRDMRPYSMSDAPNTIDCSRFTREVANHAGYNIPRVAFDQARWYQRNGHWENNVNNSLPGDHIFWQRGVNAYHTGIVVSNILQANGTRIIRVVQAQTYNHRPGSIQLQRLMANGQMRGFGQPFVGVGRYP